MNTKQLLLGLSILVPAVCGAAPHAPIQEKIASVPLKICDLRYTGKKGDDGFGDGIIRVICYDIKYHFTEGLVFAQVDTLYGTFFGFALPTTLGSPYNNISKAARNLVINTFEQTPGIDYLGSADFFKVYKTPMKLY